MFGLESGSDRMLKKDEQGHYGSQAEWVIQNCGKADVNFKLFVIMGQPGETLDDAWETRRFLLTHKPRFKRPAQRL